MAGVSRGMLGAVGLPLTGALDLVSGVTAGIASSTGVARQATVRRAQQCAGTPVTRMLHTFLWQSC